MKMLKILIYFITVHFFHKFTKSDEISIFNESGHVEFAKVLEFKINFRDFATQTTNFFIEHSFVSIIANVNTTDIECKNNKVVKFNFLYQDL